MPELPEVETIRRRLAPVLEGATIARAEIVDSRLTRPVNPNLVAAPLPNADQSILDKWTGKLKSMVGLTTPTLPGERSTYFPSLSRRNRERAQERMWRRD